MAGARRAVLPSALRASCGVIARPVFAALALGAGDLQLLVERRDQLLHALRLVGELLDALARRVQLALVLGDRGALGLHQPGQLLVLAPQLLRPRHQALALAGRVRLQPVQFLEIGDQRLGLDPHVRQHGAEQHGRAHGLQRVLRRHEHGRRRLAAHPLERRQELDQQPAARAQRGAHLVLALVDVLQAVLGGADRGLALLHLGGDGDQPLVELRPVVLQLLELGRQFLLALAARLDAAIDLLELLLVRLPLGGDGIVLRTRAEGHTGRCENRSGQGEHTAGAGEGMIGFHAVQNCEPQVKAPSTMRGRCGGIMPGGRDGRPGW